MVNICVLIVTYNRLDKLKICLDKYERQTRVPNTILVVDNDSSSETKDFLSKWISINTTIKKVVLTLDKNYGGSGGFYYGISKALEIGFDWIWIADDDAYPDEDSLDKLENTICSTNQQAICGCVYTSRGIDTFHRRSLQIKHNKIREINIPSEEYEKDGFKVNMFSFVGCALSRAVIEACGLPIKDYFIWFDDTEYSLRVNEKYDIICVPSIRIFHDVSSDNSVLSWKTYYGARNRLDMIRRHFSKKQLNREVFLYKLRLFKKMLTNHRYYLVLRDAFVDFKKTRLGVSEIYYPGRKIL